MELYLPSFQILFTTFLFLFLLLKILTKRSKTTSSDSKLPPRPWKLPIAGNLHQLVGTVPHQALRELAKKHGPLMHLKLGQLSTVVVSSPEIAKEIMKTHDAIFASRPEILVSKIMSYNSTSITFSPYGEYWRQLRKICVQELLSTAQVQSYRPIREEELSNLIHFIGSHAGSAINLTEKIHSTAYSITSKAAFGKKCKEQEKFVSVAMEVTKAAGGFDVEDLFPSVYLLHLFSGLRTKLERLQQETDRILDVIIKEHKEAKATRKGSVTKAEEDIVDVLLRFHDRGDVDEFSLTCDNIKAVLFDIFSAGSETSSIALDWAMSEMIKHPEVMKKAQEEVREVFNRKGSVDETSINEMKYLKCVCKEVFRLHPPVPLLLPRECSERCEINGYEIPIKTKVIINAYAIGRDPKY
nr:cytochrome P450 71D11-like [Ziziphus jujuba var. spinosa]